MTDNTYDININHFSINEGIAASFLFNGENITINISPEQLQRVNEQNSVPLYNIDNGSIDDISIDDISIDDEDEIFKQIKSKYVKKQWRFINFNQLQDNYRNNKYILVNDSLNQTIENNAIETVLINIDIDNLALLIKENSIDKNIPLTDLHKYI